MRSSKPLFYIILMGIVLAIGAPRLAQANIADGTFGNSGTHTTIRATGLSEPVQQGALPGQILTPIFRLDLIQFLVESDTQDDPAATPPNDTVLELLAMRVNVNVGGGAAIRDIASIAIARDGLGNYVGDPAQSFVNADGTSAVPAEDDLSQRIGDLNDPTDNRYGIYTPDEDPIIAYLPIADILKDPNNGLNPYSTSFTVTFNLSPEEGVVSYFVGENDGTASKDYTLLMSSPPAQEPQLNAPNVIQGNNDQINSIFYFLISPSPAAPSGSTFSADLDVSGGVLPNVFASFGLEGGELPMINTLPLDDRFVVYDYNGGGLVLRTPFPACAAVDPPGDDDDDDGPVAQLCDIDADTYINNPPAFPTTLTGTIQIQMAIADQVPYRKVEGVFDDGSIIGTPIDQFAGTSNVFSQFPPNYPRLEWERQQTDDPLEMAAPFQVGRLHPDSRIPQTTYPTPEVLTAGEQIYAQFAFDFAGGWPGGYGIRLDPTNAMIFDVQGLGELHEIPRDNIDNDGDGLVDEPTVEDTPWDRQLAGRNDDFDFAYDLSPPSSRASEDNLAVNGSTLSATEVDIVQALNVAFTQSTQPTSVLGFRTGDYILEGVYNPGWDPVFEIQDIWDDRAQFAAADPDFFPLPSKYYRDLVAPGLGPGFGTTFRPEVGIRLSKMAEANPARGSYLASLMRIGVLQSRGVDEDGDGEAGSPTAFGLILADALDSNANGVVDEGIDEEALNEIDDDGDGLIDEDVNYVGAIMAIDEEVNSFFLDRPGGRFGAYDEGIDAVFYDFNNNGAYDDGRNDNVTPNRDEYIGTGTSPMSQGDPYHTSFVYPIDEDLDAEGEDGNPLTPPPATFDGIDNDGDGLTDEGFNEDIKDQVFGDPRIFRTSFPKNGFLAGSALWEDFNNNSRLDPGVRASSAAGGDDLPGQPNVIVSSAVNNTIILGDPDHYYFTAQFTPETQGLGPNIPIHTDARYDFFYGVFIPANMPIGLDYQISLLPGNINFEFDTRSNFNPGTLRYPTPTYPETYIERYPALQAMYDSETQPVITRPAKPALYEITKRQIAHMEMFDAMGYKSPIERAGGFRGLPYLDTGSEPTPIVAINMADAVGQSEGSLGLTTDPAGGITESFAVLSSIRINFDPVQLDGGLFDPTGNAGDLRPLTDEIYTDPDTNLEYADSGVALYLDNKSLGRIGEFDPQDIPVEVNLETLKWNEDPEDPVAQAGGYYVTLQPVGGIPIPNTDFYEPPNQPIYTHDVNRGYDLYVCVRTSPQAGARNTFRAFIRPGDIQFVNGVNSVGSELTTTTYTINPPTVFCDDPSADIDTIPNSDSIPLVCFNLYDENQTFSGTPARLSTLSFSIENVGGDLAFTPTDLQPLTGKITQNIPLDPGEDNDNNPETFPIPDGIDNDNDGLTDEGLNNSLSFDPNRYTSLSGVALFRDMPNSDTNGGFDDPLDPDVVNPDLPVFLSGSEQFAFPVGLEAYITLAIDHDPLDNPGPGSPGKGDPVDPEPFETLPVNDVGVNFGGDYFIVVRTSKSISAGDDFNIRFETTFESTDSLYYTNEYLVGVPFGFMPGFTQGTGPVFPNRQPYQFDPLINATLGGGGTAQQPTSPGALNIPGFGIVQIDDPFDLYEGYYDDVSVTVTNTVDGSDVPTLSFLLPRFNQSTSFDDNLLPGSIFLRWNDIDEDSPNATVSLYYYPIVIDPLDGEIFPSSPNDSRFTFTEVRGVRTSLNPGDELDDFVLNDYIDQPIASDNENVDPVTGLGNDLLTWDARLVPNGIYRIVAFLDDDDNPINVAVSGKIIIENNRPVLELIQP
ncbi:MAG: hypothetical protein KC931_00240 [Candidatus Omnitrophica bacterium]|nr:hypothetical protein [Candidatus Omnitrophota bacterium]